ncbi:type II toxin-antitoxin system VapC family toxin [Tsukamurella sp. M9C]|uniref:type II toxin-antitoxin system VapC family toxin n=1 Tax=Tsukamurella sp. M9C TaxID=2877520 RepID=UPI001CCE8617|nr:type II toxin-antitoxin system VapC family toxin [Tsukamurella sp. M9C]MCA0158547.1 type II toxin-antitoxin system VapC family toxin [Tsukamurella sp. M9C]
MDTSALTKLIIAEHESDALTMWVAEQTEAHESLTTSDVGRIELMRTAARLDDDEIFDHARYVANWINGASVTEEIVAGAERIGLPTLRSLDAIHLASAVSIHEQLSAFVSYDKRLLDAARAEGLTVVSPGAE